MRVDLFDFELPEDRVALRPAEPRDMARMLVVPESGAFLDRGVRDLPSFLRAGDALVVNDTKVIPARLRGVRVPRGDGGKSVRMEVLLLKQTAPSFFSALARPAKRLQIGRAHV